MPITEELLGPGTFFKNRDFYLGNVIGLHCDFLNAADASAAEEWEEQRPSLDNNGHWITASPVYKCESAYSFSLLDKDGDAYHIVANISKLERPSLPFPNAPIRPGVVALNVNGYGVAYYAQELRLSTVDVFGDKDPATQEIDFIRESLANIILKNASFFETAQEAAKESARQHKFLQRRP